jgi:hypothetical protein
VDVTYRSAENLENARFLVVVISDVEKNDCRLPTGAGDTPLGFLLNRPGLHATEKLNLACRVRKAGMTTAIAGENIVRGQNLSFVFSPEDRRGTVAPPGLTGEVSSSTTIVGQAEEGAKPGEKLKVWIKL